MSRFDGVLFGAELLFIPMAVALWIVLSRDTVRRLIGLQLLTGLVAVQLVLLSIAFGTEQFADAGIALALLASGGAFAYAHFLERWL